MIADKTDRPAANGVGLSIENMNTCSMLNYHNFMKIMMMLGKSSLGQSRFDRHRRFTCRKKIHAMQYGHDDFLPDQMNMAA
ncbi:hypothetical protein D3C73_1129030 [compost metagenome]|jgi:hypothetical protein